MNNIDKSKKFAQKEASPIATLFTIIPTTTGLGSKPLLRCERKVILKLRQKKMLKVQIDKEI